MQAGGPELGTGRDSDDGNPEDLSRTESDPQELGGGAGRRILVVEDDLRLRNTVSSFLQDEGFEVETAGSGSEALDCIRAQTPSLVLLDMHLPIMNGWELARELRARGPRIPIVVMTAARDARRVAEEIGAVAYVSKPVSLPSLVRSIDHLTA